MAPLYRNRICLSQNVRGQRATTCDSEVGKVVNLWNLNANDFVKSYSKMGDEAKLQMIIDTDCGVDDALALLLALDRADVVGITCCHGNAPVHVVWQNVHRVLHFAGKTNIPVFMGCERPLVQQPLGDAEFHGKDGFGGVSDKYPMDDQMKPNEEPAAIALTRLVSQNPKKLTVVALGPLTNLAIAQRLDPSFSDKLKCLVYMGGNITGFGNIDIASEFNFHSDPEAALVILEEFTCPLQCIPWEPCFHQRIPWEIFRTMTSMDTPRSEFLRQVTAHTAGWVEASGMDGFFPCDLFAMAFVLNPKVASSLDKRHVTVELQGNVTRGEMVVERRSTTTLTPNVEIVIEFDPKIMYEYISKFLQ